MYGLYATVLHRLTFITVVMMTSVSGHIPTTLDGPFKPVTRKFDPNLRMGSDDLPMDHPRLKKNVSSNFPEQIALAISSPKSMWVSWITGDAQIGKNVTPLDPSSVGSEVWYGKQSGKYSKKRKGVSMIYNQLYPFEGLDNYTSGIIHHVKIDGLEPGSTYYYKCGDSSISAMSNEHVFEMLPLPGPNSYPRKIAVVGDLGLTANTTTTIDHLITNNPSMVLMVGDLSYANQYLTTGGEGAPCFSCAFPDAPIRETYQPRWDGWGRFMEPLISKVPMMVIEGNHEIEPQAAGITFESYLKRFSVPSKESRSNTNFYYSFDAGGVHFIMLGAYVDYNRTGAQYAWLQKDLNRLNRSVTPWLVAAWHSPWYNSYSSHYQEFECMRLEMEHLLYQYRVDIVFSGHVHAYERMNRVYNYSLDPCGPVYITIGDGGNIEKIDVDHADEPGKCPSPGDNVPEFGGVCHTNFTSGPAKGKFCWDKQPEWSAYRESSFGHGIIEVVNSTYALWTWHRNQDMYKENSTGDQIYIVRQPELCLVSPQFSSSSFNPQTINPITLPMEPEQEISKKAAKKEAAKAEKLRRKQEAAAAAAAASGVAGVSIDGPDPLAANYGDIPVKDLQSKAVSGRVWTKVSSLSDELKDQTVLIRGRAQAIRAVGKKMAFLTVREIGYTVQCVLTVAPDVVSAQMVKFATAISKESFVDIEGVVTVPPEAIKGASQQVEIQVRKIYCVNRAAPVLPINVEDAARSEVEIEKALEAGEQLVRVNQDTRLNYRMLDMRTPANQAIFRLECQVSNLFRQFLLNEDFVEIQTPKLTAGTSEGGAAVFKLEYKKQPACLAQSPQLHKQMAICGDFGRVFVVGPVFRAEDSYTHRHLCEFTGLDVEMEIKEHYSEVMDVVDRLFVEMFDKLNERCQKQLEAIGKQYPFTPLKYLRKTLRLTFEEGIQMLKEAGVEVDPLGDLNTESERTLGKLVLEKYGTEFYILHRYPLAVRPFYTMPCPDNEAYSNSFDVFIRGEEIISGAQRVHVPELLESRATQCGIDVKTISSYIDSFRYGAPPHGGFGVGLERVVMLFCALDNIRKTSLFPRDPRRLEP